MRCRAGRINRDRWVSPFGNRRVKGCSHLTDAYRSVPRPSSPVCAKASTNCPYLTLVSPHHQQQHWITLAGDTKLGRAVSLGFTGPCQHHYSVDRTFSVRMIIISARLLRCTARSKTPTNHRLSELPAFSLSTSSLRCLPVAQSRYLHGIDFKNPFTMSKRSQMLHKPPRRRGGTVSLHQTGYAGDGGAYRDRTDDLMLAKQPLSQLS